MRQCEKGVPDTECDYDRRLIHPLQRAIEQLLKSQTEFTHTLVDARRIVTNFNHSGECIKNPKFLAKDFHLSDH